MLSGSPSLPATFAKTFVRIHWPYQKPYSFIYSPSKYSIRESWKVVHLNYIHFFCFSKKGYIDCVWSERWTVRIGIHVFHVIISLKPISVVCRVNTVGKKKMMTRWRQLFAVSTERRAGSHANEQYPYSDLLLNVSLRPVDWFPDQCVNSVFRLSSCLFVHRSLSFSTLPVC